MERYNLIWLVIGLIFFGAHISEQDITAKNQLQDYDSRIVNGRLAKEGEFPFMVALHVNYRFRCSACLIAPTIVLTAAHCVRYPENGTQPLDRFYAFVGTLNRNGPEIRITFVEVVPHPGFKDYSTSEADIAILRIREPLELNQKVQPICLPAAHRRFDGKPVTAVGWGKTSTDAESGSMELRTTQLQVMNHDLCKLYYRVYNATLTEKHLCVYSNRNTGPCFGDSGSPMVYNDTSSGQLISIGVGSFANPQGCGRRYAPSGYTANSEFTDWLVTTVGENVQLCFV